MGLFLWCCTLPIFINIQTYLLESKLNFFLHSNSCFVVLGCEYFPFFNCSFYSKFLHPKGICIIFLILHWKFHMWSHQGCEEGNDYHWFWRFLQLRTFCLSPRIFGDMQDTTGQGDRYYHLDSLFHFSLDQMIIQDHLQPGLFEDSVITF